LVPTFVKINQAKRRRRAGAIAFAYRPQQFAVYYSYMHAARAFVGYTGCP